MTLKQAERVLYAFIAFVPPGDAWKQRGILSASVFHMGENFWSLVIVFKDKRFFKYIPDSFGRLRVIKKAVA